MSAVVSYTSELRLPNRDGELHWRRSRVRFATEAEAVGYLDSILAEPQLKETDGRVVPTDEPVNARLRPGSYVEITQ